MDKIIEEERKRIIEKTCQWFEEHLPYGVDAYYENDIMQSESIDNLVDYYREYIEKTCKDEDDKTKS